MSILWIAGGFLLVMLVAVLVIHLLAKTNERRIAETKKILEEEERKETGTWKTYYERHFPDDES